MSIIKNFWDKVKNMADTSLPDGQTAYFKNGKMYKLYPTDSQDWYDTRFIVSDNVTYDLEKIESIKSIVPPDFSRPINSEKEYGITGSLDYVLRMKAGRLCQQGKKELSSACIWKAVELMFKNTSISYRKSDFTRLIKVHLDLQMYDEAQKAKEYLENRGFIFTEIEFNIEAENKKQKKTNKDSNIKKPSKPKNETKQNLSSFEKELITVKNITKKDMYELQFSPFLWNTEIIKIIREGMHPLAYMNIVGENIDRVFLEIDKINFVIKEDLKKYPQLPHTIKIDTKKLVFSSSTHEYTRIICTPKTYTGKLSKYPYTLYFATDLSHTDDMTFGELTYNKDGKVEKARINFWKSGKHIFLTYKTIDAKLVLASIE